MFRHIIEIAKTKGAGITAIFELTGVRNIFWNEDIWPRF